MNTRTGTIRHKLLIGSIAFLLAFSAIAGSGAVGKMFGVSLSSVAYACQASTGGC